MNPPPFQVVTADRVENWLEARIFENMFVGAPWDQYQSDEFANLYFFDFLNDPARIEGGFDHTPADGWPLVTLTRRQLSSENWKVGVSLSRSLAKARYLTASDSRRMGM